MASDPVAIDKETGTRAYYEWAAARSAVWREERRKREEHLLTLPWQERYPERIFSAHRSRSYRYGGDAGNFNADGWYALCLKHGVACLCCGTTERVLVADHVIPLHHGGRNDVENIQPLCPDCNARKGEKTIDYRSQD